MASLPRPTQAALADLLQAEVPELHAAGVELESEKATQPLV